MRRAVVHPLLLTALVLVAFGPVLSAGFVFDDRLQILENPRVTQPGNGVAGIFREPFPWRGGSQELYRPLTILSYRLNTPGGTPSGPAFHAVNVLMHLGATLLVYALLRSSAGSAAGAGAALFGAGVFAVVPAHAEAVLWVCGRSEVAVGLLAAVALLIAARDLPDSPVRWSGIVGIAAAFLAGLLFKESMAALLPILFLMHLGGAWGNRLAERVRVATQRCVPLLVPLALYIALRAAALGALLPHEIVAGKGAPFVARLAAGGRILWEAASRMAYLPSPSVEYWWPDAWTWTWRSAAGWLLAAGCARVAIRCRSTALRWGLTIAGAGLLPYLHLVPFGEVFAERFLYLPSIGFVLVAFDLARRVGALPHARWFSALGAAIVAAFGLQTFAYAWVWQDDARLWEYTYEVVPDSPLAIHNLAKVRMDQGRFEDALRLLDRLRKYPDYDLPARRETLRVYGRSGRTPEGIALAADTLALHPEDPETLYLLGRHLVAAGRRAEAERLAVRLEERASSDRSAGEWGRKLREALAGGYSGLR